MPPRFPIAADAIRALRVPSPKRARIRRPSSTKISCNEMKALTAAAYAGFRHAAIAPLTQVDDNLFALELSRTHAGLRRLAAALGQ